MGKKKTKLDYLYCRMVAANIILHSTFFSQTLIYGSRDNTVSKVTSYGLQDRVLFPARADIFV